MKRRILAILLLTVIGLFCKSAKAQGDAAIMLPVLVSQLTSLTGILNTMGTQLSFMKKSADALKSVVNVITFIQAATSALQCADQVYDNTVKTVNIIQEWEDAFAPEDITQLLYLLNYSVNQTIEIATIIGKYTTVGTFNMNDYERLTIIKNDLRVLEQLSRESVALGRSVEQSVAYYQARQVL